jgi:hypothetical protein
MSRSRDQAGSAIVEVTWLTLLLLVPLVYLLLTVFEVQRAAFGVDAATRAAGRAFVLAPDEATARRHAHDVASTAMRDHGVVIGAEALRVRCHDGCLQPGSAVTVSLDTQVRLPLVPDWFGDFEPSVRVSAEHEVPYGTFRESR